MTPIEQVRESVTHELKCHPEPFQASKRGEKNFEFRKDDRDYRVGDNLHLREWMPGSGWDNDGGNEGDYTGDECHRRVDYIIREGFGIPKGYCIMSLALLKTMEGDPVMWMSSTGMTLSHSEYKMWRDTTDERGPGYMKTFTIPLYASTHTKTITVDQIMEVAAEWLNEMEGMHSYMNTYLLRDRLTAKFK